MSSQEKTRLDPEIGYLVLLTRAGLKPLSRWEAALGSQTHRAIQRAGLHVDTVERRTRFGRRIGETVFSKKSSYIELYRKRYGGTRLRDTPADARFQGRLFGYPSCCVEAFVAEPYTPNGLDPGDQEILFHWACPSCKTTPGLVREYRRAAAIWGFDHTAVRGVHRPTSGRASGALSKVAASLALTVGTAALATSGQNPHQHFALDDADRDGFSVGEEMRMGTNWNLADTDGDQANDGEQLGAMLAYLINNPGPWVTVHDHAMMGIVYCNVCGQSVNMGYMDIENALNGLSAQLYYIGLHGMENGCLAHSYRYCDGCGSLNGQVDLDHLKRVLQPHWTYPHSIPPRAGDTDGDGLTDDEENVLGTNPGGGDDGRELAEDLLDVITQLPREVSDSRPYLLEHGMDGVEQCEICGGTFDMGMVEVVSPRDDMSVMMPYVGLHTLGHGGFAYDGTTNDGEVLPLVLRTVLTANGAAHWVALDNDSDDDGLLDSEEAFFGLDPGIADEDGTEKPDGRELAPRMAAKISMLPEGPLPAETYVIHHRTRGYYDCLVCGEMVDMGFMEVVDPVAGKTVNVPYYNHHFMESGSFSTDRDDLYPRVDPTLVGDVVGITSITGIGDGTAPPAFTFVNSPNPFGPDGGTTISLKLPASGHVEVKIYDVEGRWVRSLFDGEVSDSGLDLRWDGTDDGGQAVGAGVYFCRAQLGRAVVSRKMTMVR